MIKQTDEFVLSKTQPSPILMSLYCLKRSQVPSCWIFSEMLLVAKVVPFVYHFDKIMIFFISIIIQHGGTWLCFKQYKLMYSYSFTHISIFRFNLYYSTENRMLTWGKIRVGCYFWMALCFVLIFPASCPISRCLSRNTNQFKVKHHRSLGREYMHMVLVGVRDYGVLDSYPNPALAFQARAGFRHLCWDNPSRTPTNTMHFVTSILSMFRVLLWAHLWHVYRDVFISVLVS